MAKRKETLEIEEKLHYMCQKRRWYGCEEVTIGFYNSGHGDEIVDFCTMDSKGILRCYEIKVTLTDLKSKAKKSWYGHYNYLFVTAELYGKIHNKLDKYIPEHIGVAIPCASSWSDGVEIRRNPKKQKISEEQQMMLKESMIRSMYYKMQKYKDAADLQKMSALKKELRRSEQEKQQCSKNYANVNFVLRTIERALRLYYGQEVNLEQIAKDIIDHNIVLSERVELTLTEKGEKYNTWSREENN